MRTSHALAAVVLTLQMALAVVAQGCAKADYIQVEPDSVGFRTKNDSVWLSGHVKSNGGADYPKAVVSWTVKDPTIATVDEAGKLTPLKSGSTDVVASYRGVKAVIPVEVLFAEKFKVEPNPMVLEEDGEPQDFKVTVYDYLNRPLKDRGAMFKSMDPKVLTMGQNAAHPGAAGETKVKVTVDQLEQVVDVKVKKK